ncbi:MAG: class I SAM-dependent methyltransferase [Vulcanimicrobiaceae bacterium]
MFTKTAAFYDTLYAALGKDYAREADALTARIRERRPQAATLLDVACGTGAHLEHFVRHGFACRGLDADLQMVTIARSRLPEMQIEPGDMLDFRLPERYDVVTTLFGSVAYTRTRDHLERAVASMAAHLSPTGLLFIEPFVSREDYVAGNLSAVYVDQPDLKMARMNVSRRIKNLALLDFHYLIATKREGVERYFERHELGLFTETDYRDAFAAAGLAFEKLDEPPIAFGRGLYLGYR